MCCGNSKWLSNRCGGQFLLSPSSYRDGEKQKWQWKRRKAVKHIYNSEHRTENISNSGIDVKGVLFFTI